MLTFDSFYTSCNGAKSFMFSVKLPVKNYTKEKPFLPILHHVINSLICLINTKPEDTCALKNTSSKLILVCIFFSLKSLANMSWLLNQ